MSNLASSGKHVHLARVNVSTESLCPSAYIQLNGFAGAGYLCRKTVTSLLRVDDQGR